MAIEGMMVVDLDSHFVGDLENRHAFIEDQYKDSLPRKLPTKDNERRKTLIGNRIMIGSELGRHKAEKHEWFKPEDLTPAGCAIWISTSSGSSTTPRSRQPMPALRTIT